MSEKSSNSKGESNKDLDDLLDSEYCELNMNYQNYISGNHTLQYHDRTAYYFTFGFFSNILIIPKIFEIFFYWGALGDFDTANSAKSTDKDVDTAEAKFSAETWNEEFIG